MPLFSMEPLEPRRHLSATDWGPLDKLIGQDLLADNFPAVTGAGQTVAVIDSGIDYQNPLLGGGYGPGFKVEGGYDFVDHDNDPIDTDGHGTAVAGVIAANPFEFDGLREQGVAPGAKLLALRVDSNGDAVPNGRLREAFQWVIDHRAEFGITVVNISLGYGTYNSPFSDRAFGDLLTNLHDDGVVVVAAAGNDGVGNGQGINYPAVHPDVISAGSVDRYGVISEFSQRGVPLDLVAPGQEVITLLPDNATAIADGTSFSSPYVAGAAALVRQVDPTLSPDAVRDLLKSSGTPNYDGDAETGSVTNRTYPQLDAYAAVLDADRNLPAPPDVQPFVGRYGNNNSLVFDKAGVLHFAYFDSADLTLKYATRSTAGLWSKVQIVDPDGPYQGQYVSLALDKAGTPSVAYFDGNRGDLRYATLAPRGWQTQVLDDRQSVGLYPSLVFDAQDHPAVAYYRKSSGDLRLMRNDGTGWQMTEIDTGGDVGRSVDLKLDSQQRLNVAYDDSTRGFLKFGRLDNLGVWTLETADATTRGTAFISLQFGRHDDPSVSYYDASPADLKFATRSGSTWSTDTLLTRGAQGLYTALSLDSGGTPSIVFYNRRNDLLMLATGGIGKWSYKTLSYGGGRFIAGATDPTDGATYFTFSDDSSQQLYVVDLATVSG